MSQSSLLLKEHLKQHSSEMSGRGISTLLVDKHVPVAEVLRQLIPQRAAIPCIFPPRLDFQRGLTLTYGSARLSNGCNSFKSKYISYRIRLFRQFCQNRQDRKIHYSETFWLLRQYSFDWAQLSPQSQLNQGGPNGITNFIF